MGYDIHITRAPDWADNAGQEIRSSEWLAVVREDPDLVEDPAHGPCAVVWRGDDGEQRGWFDWVDGNVYTTDATGAVIAKMLDLSRRLGAHVQGDDGESYRADGGKVVREEPRGTR